VKSPDPEVKMKLVHVEGASIATGTAMTVVDASVEECAAWVCTDLDSRETRSKMKQYGLVDFNVKHINSHSLYTNMGVYWKEIKLSSMFQINSSLIRGSVGTFLIADHRLILAHSGSFQNELVVFDC
jgi:hypothetical protein